MMRQAMQKSSNGTLVLVLGILAWVGFGCLTGLPAWIIGNQSLKSIQRGEADPNDQSMVQIGRILGMISTILVLVVAVVWIVFFGLILGVGIFAASTQPR
jgi:hypothetical protein